MFLIVKNIFNGISLNFLKHYYQYFLPVACFKYEKMLFEIVCLVLLSLVLL